LPNTPAPRPLYGWPTIRSKPLLKPDKTAEQGLLQTTLDERRREQELSPQIDRVPTLDGIYDRHNRRLHVVELRLGRYNPPVIPAATIGYSRGCRGQPSAVNQLNVAPGSHKQTVCFRCWISLQAETWPTLLKACRCETPHPLRSI
jgi:hypothetical protein